jgi:DNA-binding NarL/FixJ family response regulator
MGLSSTHALLQVVAASSLTRALPIDELSPAEVEVLHAVRAGFSNGQIAQLRGRSDRTVANQVAAILRKTGASGRRALVVGLLVNARAASPDLSSVNARFD